MKKNVIRLFIIVILIILLYSIISIGYNKLKKYVEQKEQERFELYLSNINALKDDIVLLKRTNDSIFYQYTAVSGDLNDIQRLIESGELNQNDKEYLKRIKELSGLVANINGKIDAMGKDISTLKEGSDKGIVNGDSITYKRGSILNFSSDTGRLKWNAFTKLDSDSYMELNWKYSVGINADFVKEKDRIKVNLSMDDPNAVFGSQKAFYYDPKDDMSKYEKWLYKNRKWLRPLTYGATFFVGVYLAK